MYEYRKCGSGREMCDTKKSTLEAGDEGHLIAGQLTEQSRKPTYSQGYSGGSLFLSQLALPHQSVDSVAEAGSRQAVLSLDSRRMGGKTPPNTNGPWILKVADCLPLIVEYFDRTAFLNVCLRTLCSRV